MHQFYRMGCCGLERRERGDSVRCERDGLVLGGLEKEAAETEE